MAVFDSTDSEPATLVLASLPAPRQQLWRVLRTLTRRWNAAVAIPKLAVEVPAARANPQVLDAYRDICGYREMGLPPTFPQVQAAGLQIHLLTEPAFPLPLLGLLHIRSTISQMQPLDPGKEYRVRVDVLGGRAVDAGIECDVRTRYYDRGALVWECIVTGLCRAPRRARRPKRPRPPDPLEGLDERATFDVPADIGRRYGRVSGDMNPIHLSRLGGRLFGLPGQIGHAMWSLARCLALLQDRVPEPPLEIAAAVKRPLLLPARVSLLHSAADAPCRFALVTHDRSSVHLLGSIQAGRNPSPQI
jgi:acyl dehydratase